MKNSKYVTTLSVVCPSSIDQTWKMQLYRHAADSGMNLSALWNSVQFTQVFQQVFANDLTLPTLRKN